MRRAGRSQDEKPRRSKINYDEYRHTHFAEPPPAPRFRFRGTFEVALFFEAFDEAVAYYRHVLGPPAYVEGTGTRGWPIGSGWLTLLRGRAGAPTNVEIVLHVESADEAEALQRAFIDAGGEGQPPRDALMYTPIRSCPVRDPFGTPLLIVAPLAVADR